MIKYFTNQKKQLISRLLSLDSSSYPFSQSGQALLEITIATGLTVIVVTAITITTIIGLRNSQFAQNQVQATKLAQEGIEQVKAIKNGNCGITVGNAPADDVRYYWFSPSVPEVSMPLLIWSRSFIPATTDPAEAGTDKPFNLTTAVAYLDSGCSYTLENYTTSSELINGLFTRQVTLSYNNLTEDPMIVTVTVKWSDFSGEHQSDLVTYLTDN